MADPSECLSENGAQKILRKTWTQDVIANCEYLSAKVHAIRERLGPPAGPLNDTDPNYREYHAWCDAVESMIRNAQCAALGLNPRYSHLRSAWSGNCIEAAFKHLHYAEATLARLYDDEEIKAAVPEAVQRVQAAVPANDRIGLQALDLLRDDGMSCSPEYLSQIISLGHEAADRHRGRLRDFRNVVIMGTIITTILLGIFLAVVLLHPTVVPLCFVPDPTPVAPAPAYACPTSEGPTPLPKPLATSGDVLAVAAMGLLGGSLSAAIFIRGLYGNPTPYNVAIPLALLKLPAGATAAVLGILLVAGDFVPGFSAIDRQTQILGYSVVFGFAQQLFTQLLDRRGENLLANVPTKAPVDQDPAKADGSK
jgi:hypothetical protein